MKKICLIFSLSLSVTLLKAQCIDGNCTDGIGMFKAESGTIYEGQFKNGLPHGNGRLAKVNGSVYEGQFKYGAYDGMGTLLETDSSIYRGQFRQGVKQGKGELTYANGKILNTRFRNNLPANDKSSNEEKLNFFSCDINPTTELYEYGWFRRFVQLDVANNLAYIDSVAFDLSTGKVAYGKQSPKYVIKGKVYYPHLGNSSSYGELLPQNQPWIHPKLQSYGSDYLIISADNEKNRVQSVAVFKVMVPSGKVQRLALFKDVGSLTRDDPNYKISPDNKLLYNVYWGDIIDNNGKKIARISDYAERDITMYSWFSAGSDTLYRMSDDLIKRSYDAATGKLINTTTYTNNRTWSEKDKSRTYAAFSPNDMKLIIMFDSFKTPSVNGLSDLSYKKAAVFDLNDPDYMLPLVNNDFTADYYAIRTAETTKSTADAKKYQAERLAEAAKRNGWDKLQPEKVTSIIVEDNGYTYQNPADKIKKKSSGTAGVCLWCGGSGKVTSKDVYDKGYNTTYTSTGSKASLRSVGGSTTTSVCMACHGSGH